MWKHILFDLDGTLTDPADGICGSAAHALETLGRPVPERRVLEGFVGPPLNEGFTELAGLPEADIPRAVEAFREYFARQGIHENEIYPGMAALLADLVASGRTLYVATTKPKPLAEQVLENFDIAKYFTLVCGSGLEHVGRPKGEVVAEVLAKAGIGAGDAVMVGDRRHDVAGAHENSLPCVGVLFGYGGLEELTAAGADYIAEDVDGLQAVLMG